jgi:hypothetical protein
MLAKMPEFEADPVTPSAAGEPALIERRTRGTSRFHPALVVLAVGVLLVFWPILQADFVEWDNGTLIYANEN